MSSAAPAAAPRLFAIAVHYRGEAGTDQLEVKCNEAALYEQYRFWERRGVREALAFSSRTVAENTGRGQRVGVLDQGYVIFCHVSEDGLGVCFVAEEDYPARVAFTACREINEGLRLGDKPAAAGGVKPGWAEVLSTALGKYADPYKADALVKIQKDLEDTMCVMHQNIEKILDRGAKLDELVEKSKDLSTMSKTFYKTAKKANRRCCVVM